MFDWLEFTPLALWVKESWGWPFALTLHAFGTATIVGFAIILCLSALGVFKALGPMVLRGVTAWIWFGLLVQTVSGFLLLTTKPNRYFADVSFDLKLALIVVGIITTMRLGRALDTDAQRLAFRMSSSDRAKMLSIAMAIIWLIVLVVSKWVNPIIVEFGAPSSSGATFWSVALLPVVASICFVSLHLLNRDKS